jgi:RHS repeat-associated protein
VDTLTGAVFDRQFEFRLTGPLELLFYRQYDSSRHGRCFSLGWGHAHDFDRVVRFDGDGIKFEAPVGRIFPFTRLANDGDESALYGFFLRRKSSRQYHLFRHGEPSMEFEFDQSGQVGLLKRLFRGTHQISFHRNAAGRLECIVDSAGRRIVVVEESNGVLTSLTLKGAHGEPDLLLMAYEYDSRGNLVATRNGSGHGHTFAYDKTNRLVRRTGRKGFSFRFVYDDQGRCIKSTGDNNIHGVTLEYKAPGRVTKVTRADGGIWTYLFDPFGNLTEIQDPLGGSRKFLRDEVGQLTTELDQNNNTTRFLYDRAGQAIAKIDSLGYRIPLPEDQNAPPPLFHRVPTNPVEYEYGRLLDVEQITLPGPESLQALPLSSGAKRLVVCWPEQYLTSDTDRRITVRPLGGLWWPYPKQGRIFNELGDLVRQCDDFGRLRHWTYDASDNLSEYVDFDGRKWCYDHGSWHFYPSVTNPLGAKVTFSHTSEGEVASCTDAGGTRSDYRYDFNGHLIEVKRHGAVRDRYTRDAVGKLLAKYAGDGRELLRIELGHGNLRTKVSLASGDEHTFEYDTSGRYLSVATKKDLVEFAYDSFGNRVVEKRNGRGVRHSFAGPLKLIESCFFDRFIVRHRRTEKNGVIITDPGGKSHRIRFHRHGLVEKSFSNGSQELAQFDCFGRCHFKSAERVTGGVWNKRYTWSGEGELLQVRDTYHGDIHHEYDAAHRLRRRSAGAVDDYRFDAADNLIQQPGLYDVQLLEGNRLKMASGLAIGYNDRNHIAARQTVGGPISYAYDSYDQLVSVETPHGKWDAEYDALGRRARKTWAGKTTEFFWNDDQLIAEIAATGRLRIYVYADPLALTPFLFLDYDSADAQPESCRRYFIFADQIGTPCRVEDEKGNDAWLIRVEPFGRAEIAAGATIELNLRFPGHYFDSELGLHYNRFRYYDPGLGRYLQSDPSGIAGGTNLYGYRLNPLFDVDVLGMGGAPPPIDEDEPGTEGTKKATPTEEEPDPRARMKALADQARTDHEASGLPADERPNTVARLETEDGDVSTGQSSKGGSNVPHDPIVQDALDDVYGPRRSDAHGDCAEPNAASNAARAARAAGKDPAEALQGAQMQTAEVRGPGGDQSRQGAPQQPCSSCAAMMQRLGIWYNPR